MTCNLPRICVAAGLLIAVASTVAPTTVAAQNEQSIVVTVNDDPITNFDVTQRIRFMEISSRGESTMSRETVIDELILERVQLQEAKKLSVLATEEQVDEVLTRMAERNNMTLEQLGEALSGRGANIKTLRDRVRATASWKGVVRQKFRSQVVVGAAEVDRAMTNEEASGTSEEKAEFQLRRVQLDVPQAADQKTIAARLIEAEQLRGRFSSCDSLDGMVKNVAKVSVRDLGRRQAGDLPQPARALLLAASEGQMTPPTITSTGVEIYAVCSRRAVRTNSDQRRSVQAKLVDEEYQRLARGYLSDLRASAFVERFDKKE